MMLLLVWKKTNVPMFTRETTTKAKNSTGTMLVSLARPPFPNVTGAAVTIYMMGATASMSKSAFAFLTILALPGNMNPRRVRIGLKRLAVDSKSLIVHIDDASRCWLHARFTREGQLTVTRMKYHSVK